jgi:hypothetical protein
MLGIDAKVVGAAAFQCRQMSNEYLAQSIGSAPGVVPYWSACRADDSSANSVVQAERTSATGNVA